MNGLLDSWVDKLDRVTRSALTLMLGGGFLYLAWRGGDDGVNGNVFTNVFLVVIGFWFGSKGTQDAVKVASQSPPAPPTSVTTGGPTTVNVPGEPAKITTTILPEEEKKP
jgi:hypothetical protein